MELLRTIRQLLSLPAYVIDGITYKLAGFLFTPRPTFVCFPVTFRCNSRCQMCNIWQNSDDIGEMDLKKIEEVFSNPLFNKVEEIVLHGGEPTLRKDIKDVYRIIVKSCPELKSITTSTNGLNPGLVDKRTGEIVSAVDTGKVKLIFTVSIDGLKDSHEKIRGIKGGFDRAIESLKVLKKYREKYPIGVQIITVIQPQNIEDLEKMEDLAREHDVEITYQPLMIDTYYSNSPSDPRLLFSGDRYRKYREFIRRKLMRARDFKSLYWKNYLGMMDGGKRTIPCANDRYLLSIYPTGNVLPCSKEDWISFGNVNEKPIDELWFSREAAKIRKKMRKEVCPTCDFYCSAEYALKKEFFTYFRYYVKAVLSSLKRTSKL